MARFDPTTMRLLFLLCLIWQSSTLPGGGVCCNGFSSRRQHASHKATTPAVRWSEKRGGKSQDTTKNSFSEDIATLNNFKRNLKNTLPWNSKHLERSVRGRSSGVSLQGLSSYRNKRFWTSLFNLEKQHPITSVQQVDKKICCNDPSPLPKKHKFPFRVRRRSYESASPSDTGTATGLIQNPDTVGQTDGRILAVLERNFDILKQLGISLRWQNASKKPPKKFGKCVQDGTNLICTS